MPTHPKPSPTTLSLADQVRAIALEGLSFTENPYDKERYEKLLEMATVPVAVAVELDYKTLLESFRREVGCITPKLGADIAVVNDKGQLLILLRSDGEGWCMPCGWVDVGENPATAAVREMREETGLRVEALGYISLSTKGPGPSQRMQHQVNVIVATKLLSDPADIKLNHEHTEYRWINENDTVNWHHGHDKQAERVFKFVKGGGKVLLPVE